MEERGAHDAMLKALTYIDEGGKQGRKQIDSIWKAETI